MAVSYSTSRKYVCAHKRTRCTRAPSVHVARGYYFTVPACTFIMLVLTSSRVMFSAQFGVACALVSSTVCFFLHRQFYPRCDPLIREIRSFWINSSFKLKLQNSRMSVSSPYLLHVNRDICCFKEEINEKRLTHLKY